MLSTKKRGVGKALNTISEGSWEFSDQGAGAFIPFPLAGEACPELVEGVRKRGPTASAAPDTPSP